MVDSTTESDQPYYQEWVGGAPGAGTGAVVYVPTSLLNDAVITKAYFKGASSTQIEYYGIDKKMMRIRFIATPSRDLIMDSDSDNESQNTIGSTTSPIPLEDGEALLVTKKGNRNYNIKLNGIEKRGRIEYPSLPPR